MDKELLNKLKKLSQKEISLTSLCKELELNEFEILNLVKTLREDGINIVTKICDDDIYMLNQGESEPCEENTYELKTDENHQFKFVAISDTNFGSKSQQLSILNDIYLKAYQMGYNVIIHCGNISEGLYPITSIYADTNFLDDTLRQVDYIANYYPRVENIKTYFITGNKDEKHLKTNKINIGKRISMIRDDMIYLGNSSCTINIDKVKMLVFNPKLSKTYTVSYRPQQQIDSFRSEDKPNILLYGGLLQMEKFTYRNVKCISVPSVCATTKQMSDKRYSNTIGAWYITITTDDKGNFKNIRAIDSVYYSTNKDDYMKPKTLVLKKGDM
ncbi:MAG: hypothetical protein ACI4VL_00360 [Bacilli bacterium]